LKTVALRPFCVVFATQQLVGRAADCRDSGKFLTNKKNGLFLVILYFFNEKENAFTVFIK